MFDGFDISFKFINFDLEDATTVLIALDLSIFFFNKSIDFIFAILKDFFQFYVFLLEVFNLVKCFCHLCFDDD
jgi:hypothetical protein